MTPSRITFRSGWIVWVLGLFLAFTTAAFAAPDAEPRPLTVGGRTIHVFRSPLGAISPAERLEAARRHIDQALERSGDGWTSIIPADKGMIVALDGEPMFTVIPGDVAPGSADSVENLANQASRVLQTVWSESRERHNPAFNGPALLRVTIAAAVLAAVLTTLVFAARIIRRRVLSRLAEKLHQVTHVGLGVQFSVTLQRLMTTLWGLLLGLLGLLAGLAFTAYTLRQFAVSRPLGDDLVRSFDGALYTILDSVVSALPGIFVAAGIFALARIATQISRALFENVAAGRVRWGALDAGTAHASRYLVNTALWLFALAMAYPYLPGAHTEAFKGLSVLLGIMVSIGAAGPVGQIASGLILAYTRALFVGEYVRINDHEGTVTHLGLCVTRLRTGSGEEIALPNSVVMGNVTRNFSRLAEQGGMIINATVTIGYDAPWRQVHAMLLEAVSRVPVLRQEPAPYVVQTELSDFYVAYQVVAHTHPVANTGRSRLTSELHAAIQDVFNENKVQIMSPHYEADPAQPKLDLTRRPPAAP